MWRALLILVAVSALSSSGWAKPDPQALRKVDWKNRTYHHEDGGADGTRLTQGTWSRDHVEDGEVMYSESLDLHGVVYVDLDKDGVEEAVVHLNYWGGGTGKFDELLVFTPDEKGQPRKLGQIPGGDRGDGGVANVKALSKAHAVEVQRMGALSEDGTCCPSVLFMERWALKAGKPTEDRTQLKVTSFEELTDDAKGSYDTWYKAGLKELKAKAYDVATRHFLTALMHKPGDVNATGKLGFAMMKTGDYLAAEVLAAAAAGQKNPKRKAMILYNAGKVALEGKDFADAVSHFEASLVLRPGNAPTTKALAEARSALEKKRAADQAAEAKKKATQKTQAPR